MEVWVFFCVKNGGFTWRGAQKSSPRAFLVPQRVWHHARCLVFPYPPLGCPCQAFWIKKSSPSIILFQMEVPKVECKTGVVGGQNVNFSSTVRCWLMLKATICPFGRLIGSVVTRIEFPICSNYQPPFENGIPKKEQPPFENGIPQKGQKGPFGAKKGIFANRFGKSSTGFWGFPVTFFESSSSGGPKSGWVVAVRSSVQLWPIISKKLSEKGPKRAKKGRKWLFLCFLPL